MINRRYKHSDFSATLSPLRRPLVLIAFAAALILSSATAATARLTPIRLPRMGERVLPRVRHGVIRIPAGHASGRVTVIADLKLAPLAQAYGRGFAAQRSYSKLSVQSAGAREYLARIFN